MGVPAFTLGMNISLLQNELLPNDLFKTFGLFATRASPSSQRNIASPFAVIDESKNVSYWDASTFGITDGTHIPTIWPAGYSLGLNAALSNYPPEVAGTYAVTFTPGFRWTFSLLGGSGVSLSSYDEPAGSATIVISPGATGSLYIAFSGYTPPGGGYAAGTLPPKASLYFTMKKTSATTIIRQEIINYVKALGGPVRFLANMAINRPAPDSAGYTTGLEYATPTPAMRITKDSFVWGLAYGDKVPLDAMVEIATRSGCPLWLNIYDLDTTATVTAKAQYLYDNLPSTVRLMVEYSNEMWNNAGGFYQSTALGGRAATAGVTAAVQYARELNSKVITSFESVFGVNSSRVEFIAAWHVLAGTSTYQSILNEGSLYQKVKGLAVGPYGANGTDSINIGDYNSQTVFTKANRDLLSSTVGTDVAKMTAFKDAAFAVMPNVVAGMATRAYATSAWLQGYCASKGLSDTAIRLNSYEWNVQHIIETNTPATDAGNGTTMQTLARTVFIEMQADARIGTFNAQIAAVLKAIGGDHVFHCGPSPINASTGFGGSWGGYWGIARALSTLYTDHPGAEMMTFAASLAATPDRYASRRAMAFGL